MQQVNSQLCFLQSFSGPPFHAWTILTDICPGIMVSLPVWSKQVVTKATERYSLSTFYHDAAVKLKLYWRGNNMTMPNKCCYAEMSKIKRSAYVQSLVMWQQQQNITWSNHTCKVKTVQSLYGSDSPLLFSHYLTEHNGRPQENVSSQYLENGRKLIRKDRRAAGNKSKQKKKRLTVTLHQFLAQNKSHSSQPPSLQHCYIFLCLPMFSR